jgi:hypothetical protein
MARRSKVETDAQKLIEGYCTCQSNDLVELVHKNLALTKIQLGDFVKEVRCCPSS